MKHQILLIIHLLAASVWVGGHLLLALKYIPQSIKNKSIENIIQYRKNFEVVGIPSLILLLITGVLLAYDYDITIDKWFQFSGKIETVVSLKLLLLFTTMILAITAVKFIFPKLQNKPSALLYSFISLVTILAVTMLVLGSFIRIGGL